MENKRTYTELSKLNTFKERFDYLALDGSVGIDTFGHSRYLNQKLYQSPEWLSVKNQVIIRDNGCDLGIEGYGIPKYVTVHHMNPITIEDIVNKNPDILNPEYLISTTRRTHQAIHYGAGHAPELEPIERLPNDTCPWKKS